MSDPGAPSPEFDRDGVEIHVHRFGAMHGLVLSALLIAMVVFAGTFGSLLWFGSEVVWEEAAPRSIAFVDEHPAYRPMPGHVSQDARHRTQSEAWEESRDREHEREPSAEAAQRTLAENEITQVFAALDQRNARQVRKFLAAYKDDPVATELGYVDAARRAIEERQLFRSDEIVACDQCWCLREAPASQNRDAKTQ